MHRYLVMLAKFLALIGIGSAAPTGLLKVTNDSEHNAIYTKGSNLVSPHIQLLGREPKITATARKELMEGIACMKAVTEYNPQNWAAFWTMGKAYQALGDHEAANTAFKTAFGIQTKNPDVAREYSASCLELGLADEAIGANKLAITISPDDAGLYANLALAYLVAGKNEKALRAVKKSLEMKPDDKISQAAKKLVDEVLAGKRSQPKKMADFRKK